MCVRRVVRESAVMAHLVSVQCAGCAAQQDEGNANCFFIVCTEGRGSNYHSRFVFTLPLFILNSFSLSVTHTHTQTHKCTQSPLCELLNIFWSKSWHLHSRVSTLFLLILSRWSRRHVLHRKMSNRGSTLWCTNAGIIPDQRLVSLPVRFFF